MSIGVNIKKRRFELKMSQQELADAMGYKTRSTIAKIESGENDVSQKKLQKFANVLDTTVAQLISDFEPTDPITEKTQSFEYSCNKNVAIILAGGKSGRNKQNIPSQFINVHGKPIIVYCMQAYQNHPAIDDVFIVCLKGWESIVSAYAKKYSISKLRGIIPAGSTGILSLKNAIDYIKPKYSPDDFIVIQEATRPMISAETISNLLSFVEKGSATICHMMSDYVQFDISGKKPEYVDRNQLIALQSPEAHRLSIIKRVFEKADKLSHPLNETCFSMLMYNLGYSINFVQSSINNIKIVREEDIAAFGALIKE